MSSYCLSQFWWGLYLSLPQPLYRYLIYIEITKGGFENMVRELIVWLDKKFGFSSKKLMIRPRKYKQGK